jgi:hypothetical protein
MEESGFGEEFKENRTGKKEREGMVKVEEKGEKDNTE